MNKNLSWLVLIPYLLAAAVLADTARLDDTASARSRVEARSVTSEIGLPLAEHASAAWMLLNFGRVQYRLATAAYQGKTAKIYYVIPAVIDGLQSPKAIRVTWQGSSLLMDGEGQAGDRRLVWSGIVTEAWMEADFDLQMQVELAHLRLPEGKGFGFESYFEIETDE